MITTNPFAEISAFISPEIMQGYIILMVLFVIGGTILDMMHKKSAQYFFENSKKEEQAAKRQLNGGEKAGLAVQTLTNEVLTSSEFQNPRRRVSHLLTMYGFVLFVVATAWLIFGYPTDAHAPAWLTGLWHLGAVMLCIGGYWFWFGIRVDVFSEGIRWYQLRQADMFILGLLGTATFALLWSATSGVAVLNMLFFVLFILSSTFLFGTVTWSKFAHMFFKPAAAYQKKITKADGSQEDLPDLPDLSDPETQAKYPDIPEYMGTNPPYMGLGIKREAPNHY
jgi:hypothetical protein